MALLPENEALLQVSGFVRSLVEALDARDVYMQGHSVRSATGAQDSFVDELGYSDLECWKLPRCCMMSA